MAADWFQTTVGNYCPFLYGKGLPREKRIHGNIPVVSSAGVSGLHDQALVQSKGVVIGRKGTVGSITYCDKPFWPIDTTFYIPDEPEKRDVRFTYYLLKTIGLETMNSDSAVPGLNRNNAHAAEIKIPPLAEQKRIASILGALDDKIELNRRMNAKLEDMARALFKSWFVDFDPVRAKLDGRPPAGMDAATAALFPDAFEESALGLIPKGWRAGSIYEIAKVIYGAPFASSLFNSEKNGKPLIRIRDLENESPAVFTTEVHPKGYLLHPGDIAVGMDGEFRAYLWAGVESWLNQRVCVFAPKQGYSAAFVRNSIIAPLAHVEATETATTVIHIGKNDIDRFTLLIPDGFVVEAFNRRLLVDH